MFGAADDGQTGRVVTTVFELLQPFDEDGTMFLPAAAATMPHMISVLKLC
jgi:hypothetical protein